MSYDLSIVIPCYNESDNIPTVIMELQRAISDKNFEVLLVNNGSTDNSSVILQEELARIQDDRFKVVAIERNCGYGHGILSGLNLAQSSLLAWTHADMQTSPLDLITAYDIFQKNPDRNLVVKGSRKKRRFIDAFFSYGMQMFCSLVLGTALSEINAQPKLFTRDFYENFVKDKAPHDFSLDLYLLYCAEKNGLIRDFPVYFAKREHGVAKGGGGILTRIRLIRRTLAYIFKLKYHVAK